MENFKNWIEGFGFDTQNLSDKTSRSLYTPYKTSIKNLPPTDSDDTRKFVKTPVRPNEFIGTSERVSKIIDFETKTDSFSYKDENDPTDIIQLIPLDKIQKLPVINVNPNDQLPSFVNSSIYYAFTFAPSENFKVTSKDRKSTYVGTTFDNDINKIKSNLAKIESRLSSINKKHQIKNLEQKIPNLDSIFSNSLNNFNTIDQNFLKDINQKLQSSGSSLNFFQLKPLSDWFNSQEREESIDLEDQKIKLRNILKSKNRNILDNTDSRTFFADACLSMAKIFKNPKTPNQKEKQAKFIELCVKAHSSKMQGKGYDYIIWPQSSSEFNALLGSALAKHYDAIAMKGFTKLSAGESTFDSHNAIEKRKNHIPLLRQFEKMKGITRGPDVTNKDGSFSKFGKIINDGEKNKDKIPEIKHVEYGKQFMRMWKINDEEKVNYKKSRILIVDDNTNTGATMQSVHKLIIQKKPRYVDMFVPLQLTHHFKASTIDSKIGISS